MRRKLLSVLALLCILTSLFSQSGSSVEAAKVNAKSGGSQPKREASGSQSKPQAQLVDVKANLVYPYEVNDTTEVLCLVGNFAAHHNGAIITADSAVRYGDDRLECFGNVLINKNTTYAYADRADYDGARSVAALYSPMIKVIDEDVTLYAYNFKFNTLDNVGYYWGGGVTTKEAKDSTTEGDVVMESKRGYYYADDKSVVGVESVELSGDSYEMKGDSVIYELEGERAFFFRNTNIWNEKGEYLFGDRGLYDKALQLYRVTKSAYLLTDQQEVWSDSMEYNSGKQEALLWENIQMDDTTNKSLAFGHFGRYWRDVERVLLTRDPAIVNYDPKEVDSLFMRADTIELLSYPIGTGPIVDSAEIKRVAELKERMANATQSVIDGGGEVAEVAEGAEGAEGAEELVGSEEQGEAAEASVQEGSAEGATEGVTEGVTEGATEGEPVADSLIDSAAIEKRVTLWSKIMAFFEGDSVAKAERKSAYEVKSVAKREAAEKRQLAALTASKAREYRGLLKRQERLENRITNRASKGRSIYSDSMALIRVTAELNSIYDTMPERSILDSLAVIDSLRNLIASMAADSLPERDSLYRVVKSYRNVKSYRSDFQTVSDSMVSVTYDSTLRLYISPVLWNGLNQITSDQVDVYTLDGNINYADFIGNPIMSSEVVSGDSIYYNQIKGKSMTVHFEDNEVTRNEVNGNVQTLYYMQDDETALVNTIVKVESGTATFYIENRDLEGVTYRTQPTYVFAPIELKPRDVPYFLDGFTWHSDIRPTRNSLFTYSIRPSVRAERAALPHPKFPIMEQIDHSISNLIRSKEWRDRDELVSDDATEWMKALGFTPGLPREEGSFEF